MTPRVRRILIPLIVVGFALGIVAVVAVSPRGTAPTPAETTAAAEKAEATETGEKAEKAEATETAEAVERTTPDAGADEGGAPDERVADAGEPEAPSDDGDALAPPDGAASDLPVLALDGLRAVAPDGPVQAPSPLGSWDWRDDALHLEMSPTGAGIRRATFTDIWETAAAKRRAREIQAGIDAGTRTLDDLPAEDRYVLGATKPLYTGGRTYEVPLLGMNSIRVEDRVVALFGAVWSETAPGELVTELRNAEDETVLRLARRFVLAPGGYDVTLEQRVESLTGAPLEIEWRQYGPGGMSVDRARYMDRRRFRFGYLPDPQRFPERQHVLSDDGDLILDRSTVLKWYDKATDPRGVSAEREAELLTLWPNETSRKNAYELAWFAATNRYFAFAVHPVGDGAGAIDRSLAKTVESIRHQASSGDEDDPDRSVFTVLYSPPRTVPGGGTLALDMGAYLGPQDRGILNRREPYVALNMGAIILYQMSSFCAFCTFQWLAHLLLGFLAGVEHVVGDWAVAIVCLVVTVRLLLHPITKRSQVSMQRMGRRMSKLKPEMEKIQKKHADDPKRLQQEQIKLYREHGVNPLGCLGAVPLFLQTPIWIALWAMLYFAYDLRQESAFWGAFQAMSGGAWPFLGDLSAGDHCFGALASPIRLFFWNITGFNLLPFLMGAIFFLQQKYLTPPPSPSMTKEQIQQQKIMKVLMVIGFPLMLYSAPSGLTLYILTSSTIGILESRYIRRHVDALDDEPPPGKRKKVAAKSRSKTKARDRTGRAYAEALEAAKKRRQPKPRSFKKRR